MTAFTHLARAALLGGALWAATAPQGSAQTAVAPAELADTLEGYAVWVGDSRGRLATLELSTGRVEIVGRMAQVMTDIAFSPDGRLYGVSFTAFYEIDPQTAEIELLMRHGVPCGNALAVDANGQAYVMGCSGGTLARLDPENGDGEIIATLGVASSGDLAFVGGELLLAARGRGGDQLVAIGAKTGEARVIGPFGKSQVYGLVADGAGRVFAGAGETAYLVDTDTGELTAISRFGGQGLSDSYGWALERQPVS